jgi:hypothetical protein
MRRELGYAESTELERLLIDDIVLRWLDLYRTEILYSQRTEKQFEFREGIPYEPPPERDAQIPRRRLVALNKELANLDAQISRLDAEVNPLAVHVTLISSRTLPYCTLRGQYGRVRLDISCSKQRAVARSSCRRW